MNTLTTRQKFGWAILVIVLLLLLIRLATPFVIQISFSSWFEDQGIDAQITEVSLDLTSGSLALRGIKASRDSAQVLNLDNVIVRWSWTSLLDKHAHVFIIKLEGLRFDINKHLDGNMVIAGLDLSKLASTSDTASEVEAPRDNDEPIDWLLQLDELHLSNFDICYRDHAENKLDYCNHFDDMIWDGDIRFDLAQLSAETVPVLTDGTFIINKLALHNNTLDRDLLTLDNFTLESVKIYTLDDINIASIVLDELALLHRIADKKSPQTTRFESLKIEEFSLTEMDSLHISTVTLKHHEVLLLVDNDKQLEFTQWLPTSADKQGSPETKAAGKPFSFAIDNIIYTSDKSIHYVDQSLASAFAVKLNNTRINITDIDSARPDQLSKLDYSAEYDEHGKIQLQGSFTPFAAKPSLDINGKLSGIDLRSVSAFTKDTIGHSIKSGQLDVDIILKAEKSVLDSSLELSLYHFELKALSKEDADKLNAGFGFPLNTSLSLLKDRDNSIHLTIPITGDLENPDFDPNDAITKAVSEAITFAVINYYTPFGLVMAADSLFNLATALRFDPVLYAVGSSKLDDSNTDNLNKISQLMSERPGIHITLCGFTNTSDRISMYPETASKPQDEDLKLSETQRSGLSGLANARSASIKQKLVAASIDASRLVLCESEHNETDGISGVEISI